MDSFYTVNLRSKKRCTQTVFLGKQGPGEAVFTMRLREAAFEVEKGEETANKTEVQSLENLQCMMAVQKEHIKAAWLEARDRDPLVKRRVKPARPETFQDHSYLGKRNKTYLKKLQILRLYDQPENQTLSAIAAKARAGYKLVKETILSRDLLGKIDPTDYRIEKLKQGVQAVSEQLRDPHDLYFSVRSLKAKVKDEQGLKIGKKRISFILKKLQWYYGAKVGYQALKGLKELPESQVGRFQALVSDLIEAASCSEIVYSDEFKCPLHQSSKKFWRRTKRNTGTVHVRFAANTTLTVAVAGTSHRLVAVKIFSGELTCDDYELFFLEVVSSLQASGVNAITWVQDNAKWHLLHKTRG